MHLYVGTDGNLLPCCNGDHQHPLGNIRNDSIDNIVKSNKFNQLRKNMLSGQRSKECKRCYDFEDSNQPSPRISNITRWKHLKNLEFNKDGTISEFKSVFLDIRLSNLCNLKCRMCDGYFSSAIAQEEAELFGNYTHLNNSLHNKDRKTELTDILEYVPFAEEIYFAGGEPLLSFEHYEILNKLIKCKNTNLRIRYNTNFTNLSFKNQSVTELWNNFSDVTIGASLDAMGSVAEYVRFGTNWNKIEQNLAQLKKESPHVKFTVTSTVGFMNVISLIELQRQWHNDNILDISKFFLNTTISPAHLTVQVLPVNHKLRLSGIIATHINWCIENNASNLAAQWQEVLDYMLSADHTHHLDEFKRLTNTVDTHRNQSFVKVFPEFRDLLSYEC
jgi:sulfatase maturation enzyme AslB (radical SAM superfamily)